MTQEILLRQLRRRGIARAAELARSCGVSQPTVSRAIREAGSQILRLGTGKNTRYALRRSIGSIPAEQPLYRMDPSGIGKEIGVLSMIHGGWVFEPHGAPAVYAADLDSHVQVYPDLPWFLYDLRPQGYLGRLNARQLSLRGGYPQDPRYWSGDDVFRYLSSYGEDLSGDLLVGAEMMKLALQITHQPPEMIPADHRDRDYARRIEQLRRQETVGSSAAGEQPKFTAVVGEENGQRTHVIVKFVDETHSPSGQRWADLLMMEHLASEIMRSIGIPAAATRVGTAGSARYLEVQRFDRTSTGRRGLVTLESLDDGILGLGPTSTWNDTAKVLVKRALISEHDGLLLRARYWFGMMIGNTDMHRGNVSFLIGEHLPLELAPSYDMLPMVYRPTEQGTIVQRELPPVQPLAEDLEIVNSLRPAVSEFWRQCREHTYLGATITS